MANLVRARGWGRVKPHIGAQVDWSHPLARDLTSCWLHNEHGAHVDIVTGVPGTPGTSFAPTMSPDEFGRRSSAAAGYTKATSPFDKRRDLSTTNNQWTIAVACRITASLGAFSPGPGLFLQGPGTSSTEANIFIYYNSARTSVQVDIPFVAAIVTATGFTPGSYERVVVTRNGSAWTVYRNGVSVATASTNASHVAITSSPTAFNGRPGDSDMDGTGWYYDAQLWRRCLSGAEVAQLAVQPYAFIAPPGPKALHIFPSPAIAPAQPAFMLRYPAPS